MTHAQHQIDAIAAALWKAQATDAGAPSGVVERRTPERFTHEHPSTVDVFRKMAIAALDAMPRLAQYETVLTPEQFEAFGKACDAADAPTKEVTVQDIDRVLDAANDHISEVYGISALGHKMDRGRIIRALSEGK